MPLYFHFWYHAPNPDNDIIFNGQLESRQCTFIKSDGQQCRRRCVIGLPCCTSHLPIKYHVAIRPSHIAGGGKGLFALDKTKAPGAVVFQGEKKHRFSTTPGDFICPYNGQLLNRQQMDERYGKKNTAPYGIQINSHRFEDAALQRGVGSIINHKAKNNGANCEFVVNRENRIDLRATKDIRNGDELFVSYGKEYKLNERNVKSSTNSRKYGEGLN